MGPRGVGNGLKGLSYCLSDGFCQLDLYLELMEQEPNIQLDFGQIFMSVCCIPYKDSLLAPFHSTQHPYYFILDILDENISCGTLSPVH